VVESLKTMKAFKSKIQLWVPFVFSVCLCAIVVVSSCFSKGTNSYEVGFPAFFCFLPMVFFCMASATQDKISVLEKRIEELEDKLAKKDKST
jgi:hypothetical protein